MNKPALLLVTACLTLLGCASGPSSSVSSVLDYGDQTSATLQAKAWEALGDGQLENAVKYTERCGTLYENTAKQMQQSLTAKPKEDVVHDYWALNDVGTCYFIQGEAFMKLGRSNDALNAYQAVVDNYGYSQAWDPKGWFWSPASAASQKIAIINFRKTGQY
ncbi:MAG: beta-glucanase precursor [Gammaproteobacteria bacterium]